MNRESIENWYANQINKTVEEFDEYDNLILLVVVRFSDEFIN